jgi:hypothetical protein
VFDVATGAWHERAAWDGVQYRRHRSNCQANFAGQVVVGDWENGRIYAFDPEVYQDDESTQRWLRSWRALPTGQNTLKRTAQHTLQLDCEVGSSPGLVNVELLTNDGYPFDVTNGWTAVSPTLLSVVNGELIIQANGATGRAYATFNTYAGQQITVKYRAKPVFVAGILVFIGKSIGSATIYSNISFADTGDIFVSFVSPGGLIYITFSTLDPDAISVVGCSASTKLPLTDPRVMLRWSDDGGHTWSNEHWASMGKIGEYGKRVIWRRLGMTTKLRDRVYEISGSDPVKIAIMGAELSATPTSA